jgi:hypothetical protein
VTYHWHDDEPGWCPCDEDDGAAVMLNPSAIGNPDETPQVWLGANMRALLKPCACGGVNGFHADDCAATS